MPLRPAPAIDWSAAAARIGAEISAHAAAHDADDSFVAEGFAALKREHFFKALVPAELGGMGASVTDICAAIRVLGAACGSTALAFAMHSHQAAVAAWRWRHDNAPTDGLLRRIASEDLVLVSTGGADWLDSGGTATRTEGGFLINARKMFASGSPAGTLVMTSVVYDDPEAGPTVLHFGVPLSAPGVTIQPTWKAMGMRGTGSNDIEFKDVFLADAAVSGRRPKGAWHRLFHTISMIAFPIIYSAYVGVAEGARAKALAAARKKPEDEQLTLLTGEMENAFAQAMLAHEAQVRIAETAEPGPETTGRAMTTRTLAGRAAILTVERAMEVAGGGAFYRALGLERAFRDVQGARFHPLQEKPQLRYSGRLALGLDIDG
ncbi:MAG: acyl-CoA dehydrogenase [Alphaproteobacteria bacterium]|nr:acyl-CoA dehydrogenase [Alphaproteobacteria bacterium]